MLDAAADVSSAVEPRDWTDASLGDLIDHIVDTHHAYLRRTRVRSFGRLRELEENLHRPVYKENHLLFPQARSLA